MPIHSIKSPRSSRRLCVRRGAHRCREAAIALVNSVSEAVLSVGAARLNILGVETAYAGVDDVGRVSTKLRATIELVQARDPELFRRLKTDVSRLVVAPLPRNVDGRFALSSRRCYLRADVVADFSTTELALLLAHELTHARLHRFGVQHWPSRRARIERRCALREAALAERLGVRRGGSG